MYGSLINYKDSDSLVLRSRRKRFDFFLTLLDKLRKPVRILDVGGTQRFWDSMNYTDSSAIEVSLLNLSHQETGYPNFRSLVGNATDMREFQNDHFDLVFSNSVIEHLFTWDNQVKMAQEIRRVGKNYFVQTPNYWFPIEPHFVFPMFQYLPKSVRVGLISSFKLGHHPKYDDRTLAIQRVEEVKLLSIGQMRSLFPDGNIYLEKFYGLNMSIVAYNFSRP